MISVPGWASPYIGLPFIDGGRSLAGVDCEGLCRLVMTAHAGNPPIPEYGMLSADGLISVARSIGDNAALPPWLKVESPRPFDWVLMTGREKVDGRPRTMVCHLGIMITETLMLHIEKATHSVAARIDDQRVRGRIVGFVRHEELA